MQEQKKEITNSHTAIFSGHIFIFYAFDVGDDIDLEKIKRDPDITGRPLTLPKYFKHYHTPIAVELPHPHQTSTCFSTKIHNFGAISLGYKIPFESTLDELKTDINDVYNKYQEQSINDVHSLYKKIKRYVAQPKFFHLRTSYVVFQIDTNTSPVDAIALKKEYGSIIASILRFETESLLEFKKNEILESTVGYYRGDLIVIDTEASFVYDEEYDEILDFFEFANIQQLELQYFDRLLANQLDVIYQRKVRPLPLKAYLPFIGERLYDPVSELGRLKVDISVITEQLEGSIKLAGETYFSELYAVLNEKMGLHDWEESINKKLEIIKDVRTVYQSKIDNIREDLLTVLIIVLITIELVIGLIK